MGYRKPQPVRRVLIWVTIFGILAGIVFTWGDQILYFATGQDIIDDLRQEVAAFPTAIPIMADNDQSALTPLPGDGSMSEQQVSGTAQVAADGFPMQPRQHVRKYIVQPGDSLFAIAERFDIHPNTIFWANTNVLQDNVHLLQVGLQLYILPTNGVYHLSDGKQSVAEIASLYGVSPGDILYSEFNALAEYDGDYIPAEGLRIVVPGGRRDYISWRAPIQTGTESGAANPEGSLHPGSCRSVYVGTGGAGVYANPVGSLPYRITTGFAPWHPGIDLAIDSDVPIYAAETGVVVFAGWHRDGYGELVIIDHGEGWTTYYGHLANRFVGCGDQVTKGQLIGEMGMTGNATGIHLHFEIRENDIPYDPRNFLTFTDVRDNDG